MVRINKAAVFQSIDINLTDDEQIRAVKQQAFGIDEVTDVIALNYNPVPGIDALPTAEIFINLHRARQRASHWSPSREFALYLAHGCDHLTGADDASPADYRRMRR